MIHCITHLNVILDACNFADGNEAGNPFSFSIPETVAFLNQNGPMILSASKKPGQKAFPCGWRF
jgi:hypothetical protein